MQGTAQLSDEGAETLAAMLTSIRGPGAPGTTPVECKDVTPSFLADFNAVRPSYCVALMAIFSAVGRC